MTVHPVVEQSGSSEEVEDDMVSGPDVHQAHPAAQNEPRHDVEDNRIQQGGGDVGQPAGVYESGQPLLYRTSRILSVLVLVIKPHQTVILHVVVDRQGCVDTQQRHGAAEQEIVDRYGASKE